MPYSPTHKIASRSRILVSAYELFSRRGYEGVTVDQVMANCNMTRGAFYAHFSNKAELYREAIDHAFANSKLTSSLESTEGEQQRLTNILNGYLSMAHVEGKNPCPLAFLATDIALRDNATKRVFSEAYTTVNQRVWHYASAFTDLSEKEIFSVTAMAVGSVALARAMESPTKAEEILSSTRRRVEAILGISLR